ncbi:hypothetical protein [Shewanella violacea]|uniref:hypothetical protein n=1 Tax=Shewanella violacea TaxID=60217 RepID=UPI0012F8D46B|nr:hypothetical protein [Shewanella violacea]
MSGTFFYQSSAQGLHPTTHRDVGSVEIAGANLYLAHEEIHASHALFMSPM